MPAKGKWTGKVTDRIACANKCGFEAKCPSSCEWNGWCNAYSMATGFCMTKKKKDRDDGYDYYCQKCIRLPHLILELNGLDADACWDWGRGGQSIDAWLQGQVCKPCVKFLRDTRRELMELPNLKQLQDEAEQKRLRVQNLDDFGV